MFLAGAAAAIVCVCGADVMTGVAEGDAVVDAPRTGVAGDADGEVPVHPAPIAARSTSRTRTTVVRHIFMVPHLVPQKFSGTGCRDLIISGSFYHPDENGLNLRIHNSALPGSIS